MSDTVLEHPLVREYLRQLSVACAYLPLAQARELREQIAAHLDEALPPGASFNEVSAELTRLGSPRSLAAAAAGPGRRSLPRRLRNRLGRVRWWSWAALAVVFATAVSTVTYVLIVDSVQQLGQGGASFWYVPQDRARQVETAAGGVTELAVPERFGQEQGFVVTFINDSDWTQTILGAARTGWRSAIRPSRSPSATSGTPTSGAPSTSAGPFPPASRRTRSDWCA